MGFPVSPLLEGRTASRDGSSHVRDCTMKDDLRTRYGEERLPRYTSYPTAPQFSNAIGHEAYGTGWRPWRVGTSASLYFHVPFCRSMCWYCGCHTKIAPRYEPIAEYLDVAQPRGRPDRRAPAGRLAGAPYPFRRRHADHDRSRPSARPHGPCRAVFPVDRMRDRGRDRPPHALPPKHRPLSGGRASTAPASACRLRSRPSRAPSTASSPTR